MSHYSTPEGKDPQLWQLARRRASFKSHLFTYLIINVFLWVLWYFTGAKTDGNSIPWPAWTTFGWGIGLAFHYIGAFVRKGNGVDDEYDKLVNKKNSKS